MGLLATKIESFTSSLCKGSGGAPSKDAMYSRWEAYMVRYCDDFVCCFQYENEAKSFYEALKGRLDKFNLEIAEDKTKILHFGKTAYFKRKFDKSG